MTSEKTEKKGMKIIKIIVKIALTLLAVIVSFAVGFLISLELLSSGVQKIVADVPMYLFLTVFLPLIWVRNKKKFLKRWLVFALVVLVPFGINFGLIKYDQFITVNTSEYMDIFGGYDEYLPFEEDSNIVKLDSATLNLTENLPAVDGVTALFPMYSAFVNAVYPESTELYDGVFEWYDVPNIPEDVEYVPGGYEYIAEKTTDVFFDLYPTKDPQELAKSYGTTFEYTTIGTEALVFIVDANNPVDSLTVEQVQGIYSGEITNWIEVGGKDKEILPYQSDAGSISQDMMEHFMGEKALMAPPTEVVYGSAYDDIIDNADFRKKPNAIGFSLRYCIRDVLDDPDIKLLAIDGVAPTQENIENGSYSLVTPIYAVTHEENTNENVDKLIDWILSEEGQYIIKETGYAGVVSNYIE